MSLEERGGQPVSLLTSAVAAIATTGLLAGADPYAWHRERMVKEQMERRGIHNPEVLRIMRLTPRHLFVPEAGQSMAYEDEPLPIGHGATISQPFIVALMTDLLHVEKTHRVLEIGSGSGYQAAVLAQMVRQVYTIEIVPELARCARARLRLLGYGNVNVREGDGYQGWPEEAPFDRIVLTAAPREIPNTLIDQLARGGRLVAPVGPFWNQDLVVLEKGMDGRIRRFTASKVAFVPMRQADE